jgi:uncharacterized protein (TIGR01777 family)
MLVAVTGSSGLIGTALVGSLRADGHEVRRVIRGSSSAEPRTIRWDIDAGTIDAAALEGVDAVVHLAGAGVGDHRWTSDYKRQVLESRTKGTDLLARTVAELDHKPALLSGSAVGYYGDRGDEVLVETSRAGSGFLAEVAIAWERAAQPAVDAGVRYAFLRTGIVLAAGAGALGKMLPLFKRGVGGRLGSGGQWFSWISLDDEVRAIRWLLDHDEVTGPVNLTAPNPVTNADFTRALGSAVHRPALVPVPKLGPRLLLGREMADNMLFASQRVVPSVLTERGFTFTHPTLPTALAAALDAPS